VAPACTAASIPSNAKYLGVLRQHQALWQNCSIVTQHNGQCDRREQSLPISTKPRPQDSSPSRFEKGFVSQIVLMAFRQEDVRQNVVVTSLSQWLWESDCHANNCSEAPTDLQITWNCCGPLRLYEISSMATSVR